MIVTLPLYKAGCVAIYALAKWVHEMAIHEIEEEGQ